MLLEDIEYIRFTMWLLWMMFVYGGTLHFYKRSIDKEQKKQSFTVSELAEKLLSEAEKMQIVCDVSYDNGSGRFFTANQYDEEMAKNFLQLPSGGYTEKLLDKQFEKVGQLYLPRPELTDRQNKEKLSKLRQLYKAYLLLKKRICHK